MKQTGCCPIFNPKKWDNKILNWRNKKFVKAKVFTLFYMPINFGKAITNLMKSIEKANAKNSDNLGLSEHTSMWNMNLYLAVDKKIPQLENKNISGKFFSKVYEGPFKDGGKWSKDFEKYAKNRKIKIEKRYFWYTACPKCAKVYGKNYVVILGKIK